MGREKQTNSFCVLILYILLILSKNSVFSCFSSRFLQDKVLMNRRHTFFACHLSSVVFFFSPASGLRYPASSQPTVYSPQPSSAFRPPSSVICRLISTLYVLPSLSFWIGDRETSADFDGKTVRNFCVSGNRFDPAGAGIDPKGVRAALTFQKTTVAAQMPQEFFSFHPTATSSRVASAGRPRRASSRLSSRIRSIASDRFFRQSSLVWPCPFAPGISGQ